MKIKEYEMVVRNILAQAENQSENETIEKYNDFVEKRGEDYEEKILALYNGYIQEKDVYIDRYMFLEEFYAATGINRSDYLMYDEGDRYNLVDEEEIFEYGGFSDEQKQAIKDFFNQEQYKGISFSDTLTLMRFEKIKEQYRDEDLSNQELIRHVVSSENRSKEENIKGICDEKYRKSGRIQKEIAKRIGVDEKDFCLSEDDVRIVRDCIEYQKKFGNNNSLMFKQQIEKNQNIIDFATARMVVAHGNKDEIDESVLKILYDNEYSGTFANADISEMYEKYCEEQKVKEEQKLQEEQEINKGEEISVEQKNVEETQEIREEEQKSNEEQEVNIEEQSGEKIQEIKDENQKLNEEQEISEAQISTEEQIIVEEKISRNEEQNSKIEFENNTIDDHEQKISAKEPELIFSSNMQTKEENTVEEQNKTIKRQQFIIENKNEEIKAKQEKIDELTQRMEVYRQQFESLKSQNVRLREEKSDQSVEIAVLKQRCNELGLIIVSKNKFIDDLMKSIEKIKTKSKSLIEKPKTLLEKIASKISGKREKMVSDKFEEISNIADDISTKYNSDMSLQEDGLTTDEYVNINFRRVKERMQNAQNRNHQNRGMEDRQNL